MQATGYALIVDVMLATYLKPSSQCRNAFLLSPDVSEFTVLV